MATSSQLPSLKADPRVLNLFRERVQLKKENGVWVGKCPFHSEKTASFKVNNKEGPWLYHCFGCGESGSIVDLVQKLDNLTVAEAIKKVKEKIGVLESNEQIDGVFKLLSDEKPSLTLTLEQYRKFEDALNTSDGAKIWLLNERGIFYETARRLHLGYVQNIGLKAGENNQDIADKGWLVFPYICDNVVVGMKYRSIVRKVFAHQPGMKSCLFNLEN
jgi:DNA primase